MSTSEVAFVRSEAAFAHAIAIDHQQRQLLLQYFSLADRAAREVGVTLRLRHDFAALAEIQEANRESWTVVNPTFDPSLNELDDTCAFWIEGIDVRGETVLTNATRFFDWPDTTLAEELRSLRAFYHDPAPHLAAGEYAEVDGEMAASIRGRTSTSGALWVRPDHRRLGLTRITPRLSRVCAYARWDVAYCWGLTAQRLHALGLTRAYGHDARAVEGGVIIETGLLGRFEGVLSCQDRDTLVADITRIVGEAALAEMDGAQSGYRQHQEIVPAAAPGKEQPIIR
jgi:hypothetical protein